MLARLRTRLTFANTISLLALFVALGGSSYAAITVTGKNVKNSSLTGKDVKNSSLGSADIKDRSLLSADFKAGQIPPGARGPQGATGDRGLQGEPGPFPATLPSGKSVKGTWAIVDTAASASDESQTGISYVYKLATAPTTHYIQFSASLPAGCSGTPSDPQAAPGHACFYESGGSSNTDTEGAGPAFGNEGMVGARVFAGAAAAGSYFTFGTWAVTAP